MSGASAFFILIPAMYLLFTVALGTIALIDRKLISARWATLGFFIAFCSILVDGYRSPGGDRWISWFTVATHFLPLLIMVQAFLSRHHRSAPKWAVGFVIFACIYVMPNMPWAPPHWFRGVFVQVACASIVASGLPMLWQWRRTSALDIIAFTVITAAAASYAGRAVVMYLNPIGETAAEVVAFYEGLNIIFHSASALMGMSVGIVLMMTIGYDILQGRIKDNERDPLTGVGNRRRLERRIEQDALGKRPAGAAIVIDLDHFKRVNDTHGHHTGDAVLAAVGALLNRIFAGFGVVCRTGGEEFVVLIDEAQSDAVSALALATRQGIAALEVADSFTEVKVTASVGYHLRQPGQALTEAIRRADQAVYCAKTNGRDRVVGAINESGLNVLRDVA